MQTGYSKPSSRWSLAVILGLALLVTGINLNHKLWNDPMRVIQWDIKSYYAYLPAVLIHHDPGMAFTRDDPEFFADKVWAVESPSGGLVLVMSMGMAFLYLPFFLLGHLAAWASGAPLTGYSPPYAFFLVFSGLAWLTAGLLLLRRLLLRYFSDPITALVLLLLVAGTNLLYYSTLEAPMTHVYSFALFAGFLWVTLRWHERPGVGNSLLLGLLAGLIALVRPTNVVLLLVFLLWDVGAATGPWQRVRFLFARWPLLLLMAVAALAVWLPQGIYWQYNTGQWLYYSYRDEGFFFRNPQIIDGLFSYRKGWLLYTPSMVLALAGIPLLWRHARSWLVPVSVFMVVNLYVVFSWWTWWYGGSFGQRPLIESYALLAFPLAALFTRAWGMGSSLKRASMLVSLLLVGHSLFQTAQYHYGAIHWDAMGKKAYWASFGRPGPLPGFRHVLEPPDYDRAMQGVYSLETPAAAPAPTILDQVMVGMEKRTGDRQAFVSDCGRYVFSGGPLQSPRHAYQGTHGLRLGRGEGYALLGHLNVSPGQRWQVSVKRRSLWFSGELALSGRGDGQLFQSTRLGPPAGKSGWDSLFLDVVIPPEGIDSLAVYVRNTSLVPAWFDGLILRQVELP
jgi:hypothetical protein